LKVLQDAGLSQDRISEVAGKAAAEPLYPDNPIASANRRISIILLREAPVLPPGD
jgi:chemotaxis protein MotB